MKKAVSLLVAILLLVGSVNADESVVCFNDNDIKWLKDVKGYHRVSIIGTFNDKLAIVEKVDNNFKLKRGCINKNGESIIDENKYDCVSLIEGDKLLAYDKKTNKYGAFDINGKIIALFNFSSKEAVYKNIGYKKQKNENKPNIPTNTKSTPKQLEGYDFFRISKNLYCVKSTYKNEQNPFIEKYYFANLEGDKVSKEYFYNVNTFDLFSSKIYTEKRFLSVSDAERSGHVGLVDLETGKEILPHKYYNIDFFELNDYVLITAYTDYYLDSDKAEHIIFDKKNNKFVDFSDYDRIFYNSKSDKVINVYIEKDGKSGIALPSGKVILKLGDYNIGAVLSENMFLVRKIANDKTYLVDSNGKELISFDNYKWASPIWGGEYFSVSKDDGSIGIVKNPLLNSNNKVQEQNTVEEKKDSLEKAKVTAKYSTQNLKVNGKVIENLEVYHIDGHNFFKLRDIAMLAKGTESKFSVNWNGKKKIISIKIGSEYKEKGTELKAGDGQDKDGYKSNDKLEINGEMVQLNAYKINGNNYYEIRPLGKALGFSVGWDKASKTVELEM